MKVLLFGNIGAGKTTFSQAILQKYTQWPYLAIDDFRKQVGDYTEDGEKAAQQHFLQACTQLGPTGLIEYTGLGDLGQALFEQFQADPEPTLVVILETTWRTCNQRVANRDWSQIPYPPVEEAMFNTIRRLDSLFNLDTLAAKWSQIPQTTLLKLKNETPSDQRDSFNRLFETIQARQRDQPLRQQTIIRLMLVDLLRHAVAVRFVFFRLRNRKP